nr:hypothetical protein KPHV_86950 [Kitasatospora purpeofusca]
MRVPVVAAAGAVAVTVALTVVVVVLDGTAHGLLLRSPTNRSAKVNRLPPIKAKAATVSITDFIKAISAAPPDPQKI